MIAACSAIEEPLTKLFNKSLNECKFPSQWKLAYITPIYKKGPKELCNNYRPVSLLSCVGKVFERCVYKHIFNYLNENALLTPLQSGFIPGDSTVNQLLRIYNDLCLSFDSGVTTQAVYFDISKAFDKVWHRGLLTKLQAIGIRGKLLDWFCNYLSGRLQSVVIKGESSEIKTIQAGVPQGSVLGPLLFLIYINDIVDNIESVIKLFADDTSMSLALKDPTIRADILNRDLNKISEWAIRWKVKFNDEKTELLNFTHGHDQLQPLLFNNTLLEERTEHKHLGLIIQSNCKWDSHIRQIATKTNMLISCLRFYKYKLTRKALETMYKSFILPIFDYADIIWDGCTDDQSKILEDLHLEAIRIIIGGVRGTSRYKLYEESGFCSLKERRKRHKLTMFHKMVNSNCPPYVSDMLPPLISSYNRYNYRRPQERTVPRHRTELYNKSFIPSTTRLWNSLPQNVTSTSSLSQFKKLISVSDTIVPKYYYFGERKEQVIHCRLRMNMSDLKHDLFNRHLSNNSACACGSSAETAEHYLLSCPLYDGIRATTIHTLSPALIDIVTLLKGHPALSLDDNTTVFATVHNFINKSNRFP